MKLSAKRETLLEPLQAVSGVVERRQTMPILANDHTAVLTHGVQAGDWLRVDVFLPVDWSLPGANLAVGTLPFGSSTTAVHTALTAWGVSLTLGTNYPVIELDERYRRILNLDPSDVRWSRAAITSPIYVR